MIWFFSRATEQLRIETRCDNDVLRGRIGIAVMIVCVGAHSIAASDDSLSVQATPTISSEPGMINLLVHLDPDDANRSLVVEVDSVNLFRSSLIMLAGESAPAAHWVRLKALPAGRYSVTVTLHRADGDSTTVRDAFTVIK